ncbi:hypothetical protein AX774_g6868, partial [Zancudomyces culisetae]
MTSGVSQTAGADASVSKSAPPTIGMVSSKKPNTYTQVSGKPQHKDKLRGKGGAKSRPIKSIQTKKTGTNRSSLPTPKLNNSHWGQKKIHETVVSIKVETHVEGKSTTAQQASVTMSSQSLQKSPPVNPTLKKRADSYEDPFSAYGISEDTTVDVLNNAWDGNMQEHLGDEYNVMEDAQLIPPMQDISNAENARFELLASSEVNPEYIHADNEYNVMEDAQLIPPTLAINEADYFQKQQDDEETSPTMPATPTAADGMSSASSVSSASSPNSNLDVVTVFTTSTTTITVGNAPSASTSNGSADTATQNAPSQINSDSTQTNSNLVMSTINSLYSELRSSSQGTSSMANASPSTTAAG